MSAPIEGRKAGGVKLGGVKLGGGRGKAGGGGKAGVAGESGSVASGAPLVNPAESERLREENTKLQTRLNEAEDRNRLLQLQNERLTRAAADGGGGGGGSGGSGGGGNVVALMPELDELIPDHVGSVVAGG